MCFIYSFHAGEHEWIFYRFNFVTTHKYQSDKTLGQFTFENPLTFFNCTVSVLGYYFWSFSQRCGCYMGVSVSLWHWCNTRMCCLILIFIFHFVVHLFHKNHLQHLTDNITHQLFVAKKHHNLEDNFSSVNGSQDCLDTVQIHWS